jgi:hypothetical protein
MTCSTTDSIMISLLLTVADRKISISVSWFARVIAGENLNAVTVNSRAVDGSLEFGVTEQIYVTSEYRLLNPLRC